MKSIIAKLFSFEVYEDCGSVRRREEVFVYGIGVPRVGGV